MADVSFILGVIGNVISLLVFLSPAKTFWRIVRNNSTEDFNYLPYICTLLSTSLWTYYGLIKPGGLLISTINGAGAVLESVYVILFLIYCPKELKIKIAVLVVLVDIIAFTSVFLVTFLALDQQIRIAVIGVLCVCLTLTMYGSPLAITRSVIVTKSVEFMPFFLSFFLFLNGGVWAAWAVLKQDVFVGVQIQRGYGMYTFVDFTSQIAGRTRIPCPTNKKIPNGIGFGLGASQLILYLIYRKRKPKGEVTQNLLHTDMRI